MICPGCNNETKLYHLWTENSQPRMCAECLKGPVKALSRRIDEARRFQAPANRQVFLCDTMRHKVELRSPGSFS